jgi:hypothetical protein
MSAATPSIPHTHQRISANRSRSSSKLPAGRRSRQGEARPPNPSGRQPGSDGDHTPGTHARLGSLIGTSSSSRRTGPAAVEPENPPFRQDKTHVIAANVRVQLNARHRGIIGCLPSEPADAWLLTA